MVISNECRDGKPKYNRCYRREEFSRNYAEVHGLPSPGRNVNRITQSLTLLPAETSYRSVYRNFIAGLENNSTLKLLKYDAFRKFELTNTKNELASKIYEIESLGALCPASQKTKDILDPVVIGEEKKYAK